MLTVYLKARSRNIKLTVYLKAPSLNEANPFCILMQCRLSCRHLQTHSSFGLVNVNGTGQALLQLRRVETNEINLST